MIGLLYAIYLSTFDSLEEKNITEDDLFILYSIYNKPENKDKIKNFNSAIESLEKLYSKLKEKNILNLNLTYI